MDCVLERNESLNSHRSYWDLNEDRSDNCRENLILLSSSDHAKLHSSMRERNSKGRFIHKKEVF